ncbi:unnamed protein product [Vicia faba]|uniref:Uncharacterized protein n=1 Tax=Vicia faba TaxID=3906 RepID=A0AAV1A383_VICFA|nr:unnamed protein product [Vicia faba]
MSDDFSGNMSGDFSGNIATLDNIINSGKVSADSSDDKFDVISDDISFNDSGITSDKDFGVTSDEIFDVSYDDTSDVKPPMKIKLLNTQTFEHLHRFNVVAKFYYSS